MAHRLPLPIILAAVVAGSAWLAASAVPVATASAATAPLTVTCTTLSGTDAKQLLSGCTGKGAIADDAGGPPAHGVSVLAKMTIRWSDGRTTVENYTYTDHPGPADTCAPRARYTKQYLVTEQGRVAAVGTTTKGMVGGPIRASVCVYHLTGSPSVIMVVNQGKITI